MSVDAPVIALVNARVIDGSGSPARERHSIVIRDGRIAAVGETAFTPSPSDARVIDLTGQTVIPGLVMLHEHLYYPVGPGVYGQLGQSFVRLYLAGGVTTMRTGGNMNGFMDLNLKRGVDEGRVAGPAIDATAPYVNGANTFVQMRSMADEAEARAAGGLLGRHGCDLVQGLYADLARRSWPPWSRKRTGAGSR